MSVSNRAYSLLEIKSYDDDKRTITGIATTPSTDRMGDIVESEGAEFKLPIPLLWQHNHDQPIGWVTEAKVSKKGITITAKIEKMDEPGILKDRLDEAWQSIKTGLVRGLSIGFKPLESARIEDSYCYRFMKWLWLELSAVTIPANGDCSIATVKSIDTAVRAATGIKDSVVVRAITTPPAPGKPKNSTQAKEAKQVMSKKSVAEQITAFTATRESKAAEMSSIMEASMESGETLDLEQSEKYDTLEGEVKALDAHIRRLTALEDSNKKAAKPVVGTTAADAAIARSGETPRVQVMNQVPKGIAFTRLMGAKYLGRLHGRDPADIAKQIFGSTPEVEMVLRAPVAAGNTTDSTFAAPLVVQQNMASEFVELLRPATILGRIQGLRRVPFNISIPRQTGGSSVGWVGEGAPKPVSALAFDSLSLRFTKVAGIVPITQELMRFSNPAAEGLIRDDLIAAIAYITDRDFLDPSKAAVTNVSPASITNGVTPIVSSGTTADALRADLGRLLKAYAALNLSLSGLVMVMTSQQAISISLMTNALGNMEFPGMGPNGGTLAGIPVITSENMVGTGGSPVDGGLIVAINAGDILLADDGQVTIDVSTEASIQMESAPDSPATASTTFVSAFQQNMAFFRAEREIHWLKRRAGAVQFIQSANYV